MVRTGAREVSTGGTLQSYDYQRESLLLDRPRANRFSSSAVHTVTIRSAPDFMGSRCFRESEGLRCKYGHTFIGAVWEAHHLGQKSPLLTPQFEARNASLLARILLGNRLFGNEHFSESCHSQNRFRERTFSPNSSFPKRAFRTTF